MYSFFRRLLFRLDPEKAHAITLSLARLAGGFLPARLLLEAWYAAPQRPVQAFGLTFRNPVGLAAGYDKDGLGWRGLVCLGFGHIEVGTVTLMPQPGNPRPRLFRLVEDRALINRMGFPGKGAQFLTPQLARPRPKGLVLGVNIGKNKDTPLEQAALDYVALLDTFASLADYLALNVSSPNTVGLRQLQMRQALSALLTQIAVARQAWLSQPECPKSHLPVLVKLAPDLTESELEDALEVIIQTGMDGVIATNTTLQRDGIRSQLGREAGGLSGTPLAPLSLEMVRKINRLTGGKFPVIGCGGVMGPQEARSFLEAGAVLVQIYTGLVYAGPGLVKRILMGI